MCDIDISKGVSVHYPTPISGLATGLAHLKVQIFHSFTIFPICVLCKSMDMLSLSMMI